MSLRIAPILFACLLPLSVRASDPLGAAVRVPLDYTTPSLGKAEIYYELGAPFDKKKPTVFVVADGQQFFLRKGAVANIQQKRFDSGFNVVGVLGRASCPDAVKACKDGSGKVDWAKAYRFFRAEQWVGDLETVRRKLVGKGGKISLYGQSGGAYLCHQYLEKHGRYVSRAATPAAVMPFWQATLGLKSDRFWEEISPDSQRELMQALQRYSDKRELLVQTLQRQNFFVAPDNIAEARASLIRELAKGSDATFETAMKEYQVDAIQGFMTTDAAIPIRVRLFEFFQSSQEERFLRPDRVYPNLENSRNIARPLLELVRSGKIETPAYDFSVPHRLETEVLVIAGVRDHTVDYRTSIALTASYPQGTLLLLDDDHMFASVGDALLNKAVRAFLRGGPRSKDYLGVTRTLSPKIYREE